jgi:hypothetical protein
VIIEEEIFKIEARWSKHDKPDEPKFLTMANIKSSYTPQPNHTPPPYTPYSPSDAVSSPSSSTLIPSRSSIIFNIGQ